MQLHFTLPRPYSNHLSGEPYIWRLLQLANNFSWSEILMKNYIESWNYYFKGVILKNLFFLLFVLFILVHLISTGSESDSGTNSCCFLKKLVTLMLVITLWWQFQNVGGRSNMLVSFVDITFTSNMSTRNLQQPSPTSNRRYTFLSCLPGMTFAAP